jgi:PTH1 family peptidyl-tRNA hydrolase
VALRRSKDEARRGSPSVLVIVGLANPGDEYAGSRHNVGGDAVRLVVERRHEKLSLERRQRAASVTIPGALGPVTLAVPTTFMNESGAALPALLRRTSLDDLEHLVIVHDELDLEPGRLQLKFGGGLAGHNGLRSIAQTLGTNDFARLRIGIGKPLRKEQGADYVLSRPSGTRKKTMSEDVAAAADVIEAMIDLGFDEARQRVNSPRD